MKAHRIAKLTLTLAFVIPGLIWMVTSNSTAGNIAYGAGLLMAARLEWEALDWLLGDYIPLT